MSQECCGCRDCKRIREHLASLLPFTVLEAMSDKPLRIRGVAMCSGMSRNHNIYTSEELQAFTNKLTNAPVYIEHVAVPNAIGKVTKTDWDGHNLWYEAEIYEEATAEKIRKGLVQHVSVGADYEAVDVVDGKVPHGLHNAELSLVAVPGIPETNVQVLEKLSTSSHIGKEEFTKLLSETVKTCVCSEIADSRKLTERLSEAETKLGAAEKSLAETSGKLTETESKLSEAQKQSKRYRNPSSQADFSRSRPRPFL